MRKYFKSNWKRDLKLRIADWLYNRYPKKFCWASLVSWAYSNRWFWSLFFEERGFPIGCKLDSEQSTDSCYCGCWHKGKLSKEYPKEYWPKPEEMTEVPF
jgi:hypothetical protein